MLRRWAFVYIVVGYGLMALPLLLQTESQNNAAQVLAESRQTNKVPDGTIAAERASSQEVFVNNSAESAELQAILDNFSSTSSAGAGIIVTDLKSGAHAELNPTKKFVSASLYKLFVAYVILSDIDKGALALSDTTKGMGISVKSCLDKMITVSDNPCGEALGGMYGWRKLDERLADEGYKDTNLNNSPQSGDARAYQYTTAQDVSLLMTRLYNGSLLSNTSTELFFALLKDQRINNRLPTGLPEGTVIAHKTGDLDGYMHDAGIIFSPNRDYMVVLMTGRWDSPSLDGIRVFTTLSEQLWDYFST